MPAGAAPSGRPGASALRTAAGLAGVDSAAAHKRLDAAIVCRKVFHELLVHAGSLGVIFLRRTVRGSSRSAKGRGGRGRPAEAAAAQQQGRGAQATSASGVRGRQLHLFLFLFELLCFLYSVAAGGMSGHVA